MPKACRCLRLWSNGKRFIFESRSEHDHRFQQLHSISTEINRMEKNFCNGRNFLPSNSIRKILMSNRSTDWMSKYELYCRLCPTLTEIGRKNFPMTIRAFYPWIRSDNSDLRLIDRLNILVLRVPMHPIKQLESLTRIHLQHNNVPVHMPSLWRKYMLICNQRCNDLYEVDDASH